MRRFCAKCAWVFLLCVDASYEPLSLFLRMIAETPRQVVDGGRWHASADATHQCNTERSANLTRQFFGLAGLEVVLLIVSQLNGSAMEAVDISEKGLKAFRRSGKFLTSSSALDDKPRDRRDDPGTRNNWRAV